MIRLLRWGPPLLISTRLLRDAVISWIAVRLALAAMGLFVPVVRVEVLIVAVAAALVFLNLRINREPSLLGNLGVSQLWLLAVAVPPIALLELAAGIAGRLVFGINLDATR
jgi:hypothetical protein